ncbi:MAG: hypothetical protein K0U74_17530 [Alphaproteobacteria bacterium]|nr:hypothetical protein [Alphaproteobacteria bacterium]
MASPRVTTYPDESGEPVALEGFPTPSEIEAVEDYVYGISPPTIEEIRVSTNGAPLAIVVYANEYRPGVETVHRKHADMCYSRTGISRVGTEQPQYDGESRGYRPFVDGNPTELRVLPCRYTAYIAALVDGEADRHGPQRFVRANDTQSPPSTTALTSKSAGGAAPAAAVEGTAISDTDRKFWLPVHKLFDGGECISGLHIEVKLWARHVNEKLRRAHLYFLANGHDGGWSEPSLSEEPFVITKNLAEFSTRSDHGAWLLVPEPKEALVARAEYQNKPLTYIVPAEKRGAWSVFHSTLNLSPTPGNSRAAPEYLHAVHKVDENGTVTNLLDDKDAIETIKKGGYRAQHYLDFTADGWVDVECSALALELPRRLAACSVLAAPDFFPKVKQTDLMDWTDQSSPPSLLDKIWPERPGAPEALSEQRFMANLELPDANFNADDDTMTAIVGHYGSGAGVLSHARRKENFRSSMLPDGAAGVFAPGWDVSFDRSPETATENGLVPGKTYFNTYGLGSPFIEDTKLCAALSSFWPAASPDIARAFAPTPGYATATPLEDEVLGIGGGNPWDGFHGPIVDYNAKTVDYFDLAYADYVQTAIDKKFEIDVIAQMTAQEYIARTLVMARVYETLNATTRQAKAGIAVLSFKRPKHDDEGLMKALADTGRTVQSEFVYRYEIIRHNGPETHPDPAKFSRKIVKYDKLLEIYADPSIVLMRDDKAGQWKAYELRR